MTQETAEKSSRIDGPRIFAAVSIFAIGAALYLAADHLHGFVKAVLEGIGSLIAVAVAAEFIYYTFLEEVHRRKTLAEIDGRLDAALNRALSTASITTDMRKIASMQNALSNELAERMTKVVKVELQADIERVVAGSARHGFAGFVERMRFEDLFSGLRMGDELMWLDTYCPDQPQFEQPLREAVRRGAIVRMLAIQPESPILRFRAREIDEESEVGYSPEEFSDDAKRSLRGVISLAEALKRERPLGSLTVRTYDDLPCVPMYLVSRGGVLVEGYTSVFLTRPTFREPHVRWLDAPEARLRGFAQYFERKWAQHVEDEVARVEGPRT